MIELNNGDFIIDEVGTILAFKEYSKDGLNFTYYWAIDKDFKTFKSGELETKYIDRIASFEEIKNIYFAQHAMNKVWHRETKKFYPKIAKDTKILCKNKEEVEKVFETMFNLGYFPYWEKDLNFRAGKSYKIIHNLKCPCLIYPENGIYSLELEENVMDFKEFYARFN